MMQTAAESITVKGDETLLRDVLARVEERVGDMNDVFVNRPSKRTAGLGRQKLSIKRGDSTVDPTELFGIWKDREDVTIDTLRDKAWSYRRR